MTTTSAITRLLAAIALTVLLGLSAACGSDDGDSDADLPDAAGASTEATTDDDDDEPDLSPEDALLEFAQCMREQGVDMPDPEPGGGIRMNGGDLPESQMEAAHEACQKWMDMAEPEDRGQEMSEEEKQSFLDMAACMRDRGYNVPDPVFDGGRVTQKVEKGDGDRPGPEDPGFQKDMDECHEEAGIEPPAGPEDADGNTDEQSS
jgi:hypothetical protein